MEKLKQVRELRNCPRWLMAAPWTFKNPEDERLYCAYTQRQKQRGVPRLLALGMLLQLWAALVPGHADLMRAYIGIAVALATDLLLFGLHLCWRRARPALAHVVWLVLWLQLLYSSLNRVGDSYNELLGWALVLQYLTSATMPFHNMLLLFYSTLSITAYVIVQLHNSRSSDRQNESEMYEIVTNFLLLTGVWFLGTIAYVISENQQRSSFKTTKRSLGDKLTIEQQSKEQERLLLSVLPEHVAVQMRKDIGLIDTQFKKIYMSRHENVSILYADIVGFTAISSTYSAQDLVAILNELFARFDRLAEKYQQLRIKILGDCYYCISGAPVERPDHAVLCVHMGLSMVKAIKYVQQTTNSPVDMRVGIHTGAVLAGVLGQRQWQFDVYSRDVELANKMESSGKAGRVHISEVTLGYLNEEFEVEPAYGERREEMLRQAGIKTYFIVRVLKPYQCGEDKPCEGEEGDAPDTLSELRDDDDDSVMSPQEENKANETPKIFNMLEEELVNRDDDKELADATTLCLSFRSGETEAAFVRRRDPCPLVVVAPPLLLLPAVVLLSTFAVPHSWAHDAVYLALEAETGVVNILYYAFCKYFQCMKKKINPYFKLSCALFNISMFAAANIAPLIICGSYENALDDGLAEDALSHSGARRCSHPSYYYHVGAGLACGALLVCPLGGVARAILLLALAAAHAAPAILYPALLRPRVSLDRYPYTEPFNTAMPLSEPLTQIILQLHNARNILMLFFIVIVLLIYDRYSSALERARHSRGERMSAQAAQAADLRRRNQALIHNVLPPHVASHFMGARHHHRDLYSQSYAEVGVLFASMPNFSEFYSEETVNNQGLECLRFLNEVISDFDLLLEDAKYCKDITKIKTIGSTYMAASGLNPTDMFKTSDHVTARWAHLANLVEFALELQRVLAAINEQSFNHFVLRMGVNHGPITAGVIGARKPHYDIWGNTVNVASRMESTGKAGCIQVTEETCHILQEFGYYFEQRGLVAVKGKGQLMTYYLQGRNVAPGPRDPTAPAAHDDSEHNTQPAVEEMPMENGPGVALIANGDAMGARGSPRVARLSPPQPDGADSCLLDDKTTF